VAMSDANTGARTFPAFPYPPYAIQQEFMCNLYDSLQQGQIGLFESPTGRLPPSEMHAGFARACAGRSQLPCILQALARR